MADSLKLITPQTNTQSKFDRVSPPSARGEVPREEMEELLYYRNDHNQNNNQAGRDEA